MPVLLRLRLRWASSLSRTIMQSSNTSNSLAARLGLPQAPSLTRKRQASSAADDLSPRSGRSSKMPEFSAELPSYQEGIGGSGVQQSARGRGRGSSKPNRASHHPFGSSSRPVRGGKTSSRNISRPPLLVQDTLPGPVNDEAYIKRDWASFSSPGSEFDKISGITADWPTNPKNALGNWMGQNAGKGARYVADNGVISGKKLIRVSVSVTDHITGVGDASNKKEAEKLAALSAYYQLIKHGLVGKKPVQKSLDNVELSDGSVVDVDLARQFMDYYCRRYKFGRHIISLDNRKGRNAAWEASLTVNGRRIGIGEAKSKKDATRNCYLDVVQYLEGCDQSLWKEFMVAKSTGKNMFDSIPVRLDVSARLEDDIRDLNYDMNNSDLFKNAPSSSTAQTASQDASFRRPRPPKAIEIEAKSAALSRRRKAYLDDPAMAKMRESRAALPVYCRADDVLKHLEENEISILMAATGSGKTTQIPQLILDSFIDKGEGAKCNIVCTQPRRLAAISVAQRVAKERGEAIGRNGSIGYQVRFESAPPADNGSVTFCTIGIFLRRMQMALQRGNDKLIDGLTHIIVDEVHERDIDTDLLLVVLKRLIEEKRAKKQPIKVLLMSATIDPTLFRNYFPDADGNPASVVEVPGRSFPVQKHFLDDFIQPLIENKRNRWAFQDENVARFVIHEIPKAKDLLPHSEGLQKALQKEAKRGSFDEELEIPYPLVALTISHVLQNSNDGHVLVFLPGWDEIQKVQKILMDPFRADEIKYGDRSKYSIHVLHSTIPLAEQQIIFDPPPEGVRRVILSTNIAETSVTIPDVVYVVDSAKIKENRYDPERHISALVSAWVGTSNLNQRAGRAGRHRSGEYYGILGKDRKLHSHQEVEMKRMDLSNVVMHVKALDFPGMDVEDVLARTIEPPAPERVAAAMSSLRMVGAIDDNQNLTALGKILLKLPLDAQLGRLVLYGSFFKCLDQALTLAAIMSNRDPFLNPPALRDQARDAKNSWCTTEFRSDIFAALNAFNKWYEFEKRGDYREGTRFCSDNFLSKPTLLLIAKVKNSLFESLVSSGVVDISAGGVEVPSASSNAIPAELNENGNSLPLLAALIAIASQPKFAIRAGNMTYRTSQDKATFIHPSSVNHTRRVDDGSAKEEKQIFAFWEKRQNLSNVSSGPGQMYLVGCTRLDPMTYVLFGAYNLEASSGNGLTCDDWIPLRGNYDVLDDIRSLKVLMECCMLRVFEGVNRLDGSRRRKSISAGKYVPPFMRQNRDNGENESGDESEDEHGPVERKRNNGPLSQTEIKDLDHFTQQIVRILDRFADERRQAQSRFNSRPATPVVTPSMASRALPGLDSSWRSGASTPLRFESRPPSRAGSRLGSRF